MIASGAGGRRLAVGIGGCDKGAIMRLPLICAQCMVDDVSSARVVKVAEFLDENIYEVECPKGHRSITVLQQQKFELLFEIGAHAILDGYYREAVSSFTTSLERFYEFFIRVSLNQDESVRKLLPDAWKLVAVQSERQFGAFIFLYVAKTGEMPVLPSSKEIELRNAVVHRGKIPTRNEAIQYGNGVLNVIRAGLDNTKRHFPKEIRQVVAESVIDGNKKAIERGARAAVMTVGTIIGLNIADEQHHRRNLEEAITNLSSWRDKVRDLDKY